MSKTALDLFGRLLMAKVRDEAISDWQMMVDGRMKGDRATKIRQVLAPLSDEQRSVFLSLVPDIVDTVLHHLLWLFDQEDRIRIGVTAGNQDVPSLKDVSDGLAGELPSDQGWISRFSKERPQGPRM
jgi:hypothetical protein